MSGAVRVLDSGMTANTWEEGCEPYKARMGKVVGLLLLVLVIYSYMMQKLYIYIARINFIYIVFVEYLFFLLICVFSYSPHNIA